MNFALEVGPEWDYPIVPLLSAHQFIQRVRVSVAESFDLSEAG